MSECRSERSTADVELGGVLPDRLKGALVLALRMEVEIHRVVGNIHMYRIRSLDENAARSRAARALDLDLVASQGKFQFLRALEDSVANDVVALGAVGAEARLSVECVLEFVVRE